MLVDFEWLSLDDIILFAIDLDKGGPIDAAEDATFVE